MWRIYTPHFYTEGENHLNSKFRKILASFSALLVLTSVLVTGMNVFAWTDGSETYDYGFSSGSYDAGLVGRLATDFEAYKYVDIDKEGGTTAVWGPKKPNEQNPDSTSNITIWTTSWYGSYSNGALKPSTTINGNTGNTGTGNTGSTDNGGSTTTPTTGDSMPQIAFMVLALLSALGLTGAVIARKRARA